MKVRGFGAWPSKNSLTGGQRNSYDVYNKTQKGNERFPRAEEYASRNVEQDDQQSKQDKQEEKKRRKRTVNK